MTIQSSILDEIAQRLALITTANGYNYTLYTIERATLEPFKPDDLPAVNYFVQSDSLVQKVAGAEEREIGLVIEAHSKTRDESFIDVADKLATDIWIALWRDQAAPLVADIPDPYLGNLISGMTLNSIIPEIGQGQSPYCGVLLEISVFYKRKPDQPLTIIR